jgi:hypothetical protein
MSKVVGSAIRWCVECGLEQSVDRREGQSWHDVACPVCSKPFDRPITIGLDRIPDPRAAAWPSGDEIDAERRRKWDQFLRPSKAK